MRKEFYVFLLTLTLALKGVCQKVELNNSVIEYIQKSTPQATQFQKYGNVPVSTNTGTATISVPLFNVGIKNVDWNIGLNYSGGGVKVSDLASTAGLGWQLSAGGMISARVFQRADVFLKNDADSSIYKKTFTLTPSSNPTYNAPCAYNNLSDIGVVRNMLTQKANIDTRFEMNYLPDLFFLNAGPLNAKFFLQKDTGYCMPSKDIVIVHTPGTQANDNNYPGSWLVTDENGTKYTFVCKGGNATTSTPVYQEGANGTPSYHDSYNPIFALTQIENVFGD